MESETDEERLERLQKWMDFKGDERERKVDGYGHYLQQLQREHDAAKLNQDYWKQKREAAHRKIEWLRARLLDHMKATGTKQIKTASFSLNVQANGGKRPITITDKTLVPPQFFKEVDIEVDKGKVFEAMEAGEDVPGVIWGKRGERLAIR